MPGPRNRPGPGTTAGSSGGSSATKGGTTNPAPQGLRAWVDLRNSLANHLPQQLETSKHAGVATLQALVHRRKVGR